MNYTHSPVGVDSIRVVSCSTFLRYYYGFAVKSSVPIDETHQIGLITHMQFRAFHNINPSSSLPFSLLT